MRKILLFGNSASGKSTLATRLAQELQVAHLDLDSLAWLLTQPPRHRPLEETTIAINEFTGNNASWIVEGCYTDLLEVLEQHTCELIFLMLPIEQCLQNARNRPWEPHKYESKEAQDSNLAMLLEWIAAYENRDDVFSLAAHRAFYERFPGKKTCILSN